MDTSLSSELNAILKNSRSITGPTTKYILTPTVLTDGELLRKERIGPQNEGKPNKVILLVGETGTGKSSLVNAMINYMMGIRWEHRMWLEVIEIPEDQTQSQTRAVTVYEVSAQSSPFHLTVIDTPGFGDTEGFDKDRRISEGLHQLFKPDDGIREMHAVCIVLNAADIQLNERKRYILNEILSLFGKDINKHILLLLTHQEKQIIPKRILNFIKEIFDKYVNNDEYVCFKFDNCQSDYWDDDDRESYKASWDNGIENFRQFFEYVSKITPISLTMTEGVLRARKQLDACVSNLRSRIELAELKKRELEQTKTALDEFGEVRKNFQYEVDEPYKELVPVDPSWWHLSRQATRCEHCQENCHYPGCWWVSELSYCSVMDNGKCTVCTEKCEVKKHVKDDKKYVIKTRRVTKTNESLKKYGEIKILMSRLEEDIQQTEAEKIRLVEECYQCLEKLMETALKSTSFSSFIHLDFMIEKMKETGNQKRVQKLEDLKMRATEENEGLANMMKYASVN